MSENNTIVNYESLNNAIVNNELPATTQEGFAAFLNSGVLNGASQNLAGLEIEFDKIRMGAGGSTAFEIPDEDGDGVKVVTSINGVILHHHPTNTYYKNAFNGAVSTPDCVSYDGINGNGDPGGTCATCPMNQYGSGSGKRKACKNRRMLYILREGELFPAVLSLPASSLKEFSNYLKRQLSKGRTLDQIVTKISLKKATNASGITFSQAVFTFERILTEEEKATIAPMVDSVMTYAENLSKTVKVEPDANTTFVDTETDTVIEPLVG